MATNQRQPMQPTFEGYIENINDAAIIVLACHSGRLSTITRRPQERERGALIRSGVILCYEEKESGIIRWTDPRTWSPSRILGNFLVYRELADRPKTTEEDNHSPNGGGPSTAARKGSYKATAPEVDPDTLLNPITGRHNKYRHRDLVGALTKEEMEGQEKEMENDGTQKPRPFKKGGLVKKTVAFDVGKLRYHVVCYYEIDHVNTGFMATPSTHPGLQDIVGCHELISKQEKFREREPNPLVLELPQSHVAPQPDGVDSYGPPYANPYGGNQFLGEDADLFLDDPSMSYLAASLSGPSQYQLAPTFSPQQLVGASAGHNDTLPAATMGPFIQPSQYAPGWLLPGEQQEDPFGQVGLPPTQDPNIGDCYWLG